MISILFVSEPPGKLKSKTFVIIMVFGYWINSGCDFYRWPFFAQNTITIRQKLPERELICCEYLILQDQHRISRNYLEEPVYLSFIAFICFHHQVVTGKGTGHDQEACFWR